MLSGGEVPCSCCQRLSVQAERSVQTGQVFDSPLVQVISGRSIGGPRLDQASAEVASFTKAHHLRILEYLSLCFQDILLDPKLNLSQVQRAVAQRGVDAGLAVVTVSQRV